MVEGTCLTTLDPATLLPTAEYVENGVAADEMTPLVEIEGREPDFVDHCATSRVT